MVLAIMSLLTFSGCEETPDDLKQLAVEAIGEQYKLSENPVIEIKEIRNVVPTIMPPREFLNERSGQWEYLAVNAQVVITEPTYHIVRKHLISPIENRYRLVLRMATPTNFKGVLVGKIRRMGSYVSGFYAHSIFGEKSLQIGKFLSSINPSGKHEIKIIDSYRFGAGQKTSKAKNSKDLEYKLETRSGITVLVEQI
jgi:hypothetical protein